MRVVPSAALLLLVAAPAGAQDRPAVLQPARDVTVTYRMQGGAGGPAEGQSMRMAWSVAEQRLRIDPPGGAWVVIDRRDGQAFMVLDAQRLVMRMPLDAEMRQLLRAEPPPGARFTRAGAETIAGLRCTAWRYEDGEQRGSACLTDDGVLLRGEGTAEGRGGGLVATAVAYGAQDAARFRPPPGFQTMQLPGSAAGLPGVPPGSSSPPPPGPPTAPRR